MRPRAIANEIRHLRGVTLALLDRLDDTQLDAMALPDWTVRQTLWHLADSDRRVVLGTHLLEFLPGRDLDEFERHNDAHLAEVDDPRNRQRLRHELDVWGRRLATVVAVIPPVVAGITVPTAFGRLPISWLGGLRLYDEWVHQWDVMTALDLGEPVIRPSLADLLARFQLLALEAVIGPRSGPDGARVGLGITDADAMGTVVLDLGTGRTSGAPSTATITTDVGTLCLLAAARRPWGEFEDAGRLVVEGNRDHAVALLGRVRVV